MSLRIVRITNANRIAIPKETIDELGWKPKEYVALFVKHEDGNRILVVKKVEMK